MAEGFLKIFIGPCSHYWTELSNKLLLWEKKGKKKPIELWECPEKNAVQVNKLHT